MFRKLMPIFVLLFLINCGGGGGGGDDPGPGPSNDPPVANFSATPLSGGTPLVVNFTSTSTNTTSHDWDFNGDGTLDASGVLVQYTYSEAGTYTVSLTATGPNGVDIETKTNYVTVTATPPAALFTGEPTSGTKDLRVEFSNSSVRYNTSLWDFGDGNTSTDENPVHTYTTAGTYDVTLSVVGDGGTDTNVLSSYINVSDVQTPAFVIDSKYTSATSGSSVSINWNILGATGVAAAQAILSWDNTKLTLGNIDDGDFLEGNNDPLLVTETSTDGSTTQLSIYTSSLSTDKPSADGDGTLATINFTVNGSSGDNISINFDSDTSSQQTLGVDGSDITLNQTVNGYIIVE